MIASSGSREHRGAAASTSGYACLGAGSENQPHATTGLAGLRVMVGAIWSRKFLTTSHEVGRSQEIDRPYGGVANDFPILMSKKLPEFSHRVLALRDP